MKKIRKMMKNKKGFTLIELMVVVIIVGILAAVAIPLYTAHVDQAKASEGAALVGSVRTAERVYYSQHGQYLATTNIKEDLGVDPTGNKYFYTPGCCVVTCTDPAEDFLATAISDEDPNLQVRINQDGDLEWSKDGGTNWKAW